MVLSPGIARMVQPVSGQAHTKDGSQIFCRLYPQPNKPRLVLIHSLALDNSVWDGVVAEAARNFEILAYDCRGHGQSDRRPGPYTARQFAEDLASLLDHCGWPSAILAGCSMGGCVAQAFMDAYAPRVNALALIDTTAWYGPAAVENWRKRSEQAAKDGFQSMLPFQLDRWFGKSFRLAHADRVNALAQIFLANDVACYQASCALLGSEDLRSTLGRIRVPVSVIVGEEDFATPVAMAQALHAAIPGSTLTVIPGGRHLTPVESPENIAALLGDLAQRTVTASAR
jgi:3-oxoadipate enol-lactonase